ncbi:MAG TPA: acyl carrier protein [Thermoanaerobaculia bacterium]
MSTDLFRQTVQYIGEYLETDVSHLRPDSRVAFAVPGLDSFKLFEMILFLEDRFDIEFDENVMEKIDTMQDFVSHIELLLSRKTQNV